MHQKLIKSCDLIGAVTIVVASQHIGNSPDPYAFFLHGGVATPD